MRTAIGQMVSDLVKIETNIQTDHPPAGEDPEQNVPEMVKNLELSYRHLEDAAMRMGKVIQASKGGVSALGGPNTPGTA